MNPPLTPQEILEIERISGRDATPNNFPEDYDKNLVDPRVRLRTKSVSEKLFGGDTRQAMEQAPEIVSVVATEAKNLSNETAGRQDYLENRWEAVLSGTTDGAEVIDARFSLNGDYNNTLALRLEKDFKDRSLNPTWFGAEINGVTDDAQAINAALSSLEINGGELMLPTGRIVIKTPIIVGGFAYLKALNPYKTRIVAHQDFVGEALIIFRQTNTSNANKGIGIDGIYLDCQNVQASGIAVYNAYDQVAFRNVEVRNVNDTKSAFDFKQSIVQPVTVGQTVLLENCIGEHFSSSVTAPTFVFNKYQEVNMIGCKAFGSKANSTPSGTAFHFKDCRGFTLTGCSAAFAEDAIIWEGITKTCNGLSVTGQTNESITNYCFKTVSVSAAITFSSILINPVRSQGGAGDFLLHNVNQSVINSFSNDVEFTGNTNSSIIYALRSALINRNNIKGNTIMYLADFTNPFLKISEKVQINSESTPTLELATESAKNLRLRYEASATADNGFAIEKYFDGVWIKILTLKDDIFSTFDENGDILSSFNDSPAINYTNMTLKYRSEGVTKTLPVQLGSLDSGGTGKRTLVVPN